MKHEHLVRLVHFFEDIDNIYLILDLCPHQSLHDLVQRRGGLSEIEVRYFMKQMIEGVRFMQDNQVLHRDLKIGNTFIDDHMRIKIGDFGLAIRLQTKNERRSSFCGTPNYMAPEVCSNKDRLEALREGDPIIPDYSYYSLPVDIWALGVIMFNLLCGKSPFPFGDTKENYKNIKRSNYKYPREKAHLISEEAKELIKFILNPVPELRPTIDEIFEHRFFTDPSDGVPLRVLPRSLPKTILNFPLSVDFIQSLQLKATYSPTKQANLALMVEPNSFAVDESEVY